MGRTKLDVCGVKVDQQTRCAHYHSENDRISIKMKCCQTYYACITCHEELADHPVERWTPDEFETTKAVLCGACRTELTISEYINGGSVCPNCAAEFNPGCANHYHYYFKL
ncbi:CHY zinc finger protein [Alteribacter aurantiacus]|uniref:CHY zinc finger protein n=1 Tax=Alteribacter aurantiacus TaxID=254410 RepID=UPI00047914E3|nr:CHY zinc finger protein [Alteribacter aurantiacus]